MGGHEQHKVVTENELLRLREDAWRIRLAGVSLVAESPPAWPHAKQALEVLAGKYRSYQDAYQRSRVLRRWPAVQVVTTVAVAIEHLDRGTFWPHLQGLARAKGQTFQQEWGHAFLENLATLRLPLFDDIKEPTLKFLGPIVMHAGIPTASLPDYFRLVADRRRRDSDLTPTDLVSWAARQAEAGRLYDCDKPVERFLRYGGEFAVDVTDRVFELLDAVASGGDGATVPLPDRFRESAIRLRRELAFAPTTGPRTRDNDESHTPRLRLDPYGRGLLIRVPSQDVGMDIATWSVDLAGRVSQFQVQALWPGEPLPAVEAAIPRPIRSATVTLNRDLQRQLVIEVVDGEDPLLAFTEDGEFSPRGLPLRASPTWLLFPGNDDDLVVTGGGRRLADGPLPPGWAGWTLALWDLAGASSVRLRQTGTNAPRPRTIRGVASARVLLGQPVPGAVDRLGAPVFAGVPQIHLPPDAGDVGWTVSVTHEGRLVVDRRPLTIDDPPGAIWDALPRPLVGGYTIRVRGPWGRGLSRHVTVVEGLTVRSTPAWRRIGSAGLVPCDVTVAAPGLYLAPATLSFAPVEIEQRVDVAGTSSIVLVVRPPHMTMSYQSEVATLGPSIRPLLLDTEDVVAAPGTLALDLQADTSPALFVLSGRDVVQQLDPLGEVRGGVHRFDLRRLTDTVTSHPRVRLCLDPEGELVVATLTPRRLFSSVEHDRGELLFHECVAVDGLTAHVYAARAPWRGPTSLLVQQGRTVLPLELVLAGPLLVHARVEDPWSPTPAPVWAPDTSSWIEVPGSLWKGDDTEVALSRWLAGEGTFPLGEADLSMVWAITDRLPWLRLDQRARDAAHACATELRDDPVNALLGFPHDTIERRRIPEVLIRSGLVSMPTAMVARRADVSWGESSAVMATLLTAAVLATDPDLAALAQARLICGPVIDSLITGQDPYPASGRLDESADAYTGLDPSAQDAFKRATGLIPRGLLDQDSRVLATFELLDNRGQAPRDLTANAGQTLKRIRQLLSVKNDREGLEAVEALMHPVHEHGWRALSALSLGYAWLARRAARGGRPEFTFIDEEIRWWARLARIAPRTVTIDIMLAELLQAARDAKATNPKES